MARFTSAKSQILSIETMFMLVFFSSVVAGFFYSFNSKNSAVSSVSEMRFLEERVIQISELLIKTQGFPADWNQTTVMQPGFLEEGLASFDKVWLFFNLTEASIKQMLDIESYNLFVNISSVYNYTQGIDFSKGSFPENHTISVPMRRFFVLERDAARIPVRMDLVVWR